MKRQVSDYKMVGGDMEVVSACKQELHQHLLGRTEMKNEKPWSGKMTCKADSIKYTNT
jgi:hypothetical protein